MTEQTVPQAKRRLVFVEWQDASGPAESRWSHVADWETESFTCYSVGWLLCQDKDYLVLVPHFGHVNEPSNEQMTGNMQIPRKMVRRVVYLRSPAKWA